MDDFTIVQRHGVLEVLWRPGIVIGPAELDVLANTITHFLRWRSAPILVNLDLIRHITPSARHMLVAYRHVGPIALLGSDPVDRVLAAFITQSRSRTRYFGTTADARVWLMSVQHGGDTDLASLCSPSHPVPSVGRTGIAGDTFRPWTPQ